MMPYIVERGPSGEDVPTAGILVGTSDPGRIRLSDLRRGDVLVWNTKPSGPDQDESSKSRDFHTTIREITQGAYSHAGIYVGQEESIDAGPGGVTRCALTDLFDQFELCAVHRLHDGWEMDPETAVAFAIESVGVRYGFVDAFAMPFRRLAERQRTSERGITRKGRVGLVLIWWRKHFPRLYRTTYCSQFIVEAYHAAGVFPDKYLAEGATSPNDFVTENYFRFFGILSNKQEPSFHAFDINAPATPGKRAPERLRWQRKISRWEMLKAALLFVLEPWLMPICARLFPNPHDD